MRARVLAAPLLVALVAALPARSQEPPPASPPAPESLPSAPDAAPVDRAPSAFELLKPELAKLSGLARAERILRFVADHPHDDATPALAREAATLVAEAGGKRADEPLTDALTALFREPDESSRAARVEALAAMGEPRVVPVMGYIGRRDASAAVRRAAIEAIGAFKSEEAERVAASIAGDPGVGVADRATAAGALGKQRTPAAGEALAKLALDQEQPAPLRQAATDAIHAYFPELANRLQLKERAFDSSGRTAATLIGAASGAYTLGLVGSLSEDSGVATAVGVFGGLVVGGAGAYLLGRSSDAGNVGQGDALFLGSAGAWSVPTGWFLGMLTGGPDASCETPCNAVALGTHVAAMTGAWLARDALEMSLSDGLEANVGALAGLALAIGATQIARETADKRPGVALLALAPATAFVSTAALSKKLELTPQHGALTLFAGAEGGFALSMLGFALVPTTLPGPLGADQFNPRRGEITAGLAWVGVGAGLGGMLASTAFWKPSPSEVKLIIASTLSGNFLGAGVPYLAIGAEGETARDDRAAQLGTAIGGLVGGVGIGLLTETLKLELKRGDGVLLSLGMAFGAWQGFGWGAYLASTNRLDSDRAFGLGFTTVGVVGGALIAASQRLELSAWHAGWLYSGAVWGGWIAGWTAYVVADGQDSDQAILAWALVGSNLGLLGSALALSPIIGLEPTTLAWVSVFGVAGMTLGTMGAVFVALNSPGKPVATANVIGTVIGLGVGIVVGPRLGSGGDAGPSWLGDVPLPSVAPMPMFDPSGQRAEGVGAAFVWPI